MTSSIISYETENPFADPDSDAQSQYQDLEMESLGPTRPGFKRYALYYKVGWLHGMLHLSSRDTPASYFFQSKIAVLSPQLFLRRREPDSGPDEKTWPVVNFAKIKPTSRHMLIGAGSYSKEADDAGQIVWEQLRRDKNPMLRSDYRFSTSAGNIDRDSKTSYVWRKDKKKMLATVYECVREDGNEVVARLFGGGAFTMKKGGEFDVAEGLSRDLQEYLIMSAIAIWTFEALNKQSLVSGLDNDDKNHKSGKQD